MFPIMVYYINDSFKTIRRKRRKEIKKVRTMVIIVDAEDENDI